MMFIMKTAFSLTVLAGTMQRIAGRANMRILQIKRSHLIRVESRILHLLTCNKPGNSCRPAILACNFLQFLQVLRFSLTIYFCSNRPIARYFNKIGQYATAAIDKKNIKNIIMSIRYMMIQANQGSAAFLCVAGPSWG
jgi:hypothetical protein